MSPAEIVTQHNEIEGFLHLREGEHLFNLAKACSGRGAIVEIGSFKGLSTLWLGRGSLANATCPIYAVDPHIGSQELKQWFGEEVSSFKEFQANMQRNGLTELVHPLRQTSEAAREEFDRPIELLFIDGDHSYEGVRKDFELWSPLLIEGGVIAFHDTSSWSGPARLVEEELFNSEHFARTGLVKSLAYGTRVSSRSALDRLRSQLVLAHLKGRLRRRRRRDELH